MLESYTCCALSTGHLSPSCLLELDQISSNMVMSRDTGYFLKLYDDLDMNICFTSKVLNKAVAQLHAKGYRLIEFDRDAEEVSDLPTFDH